MASILEGGFDKLTPSRGQLRLSGKRAIDSAKNQLARLKLRLERVAADTRVKLYIKTAAKIAELEKEIGEREAKNEKVSSGFCRSRRYYNQASSSSSSSEDDDDSGMDLSADTASCDPRPSTTNAATVHLSTAKLSYGNSVDKVVCLARTSLPPIESVSIPGMQDYVCIHFAKRIKSAVSASEEERRSLIADLNAAIQKMDTKAKSERNPALRGMFAGSIADLKMQLETFQSQAT